MLFSVVQCFCFVSFFFREGVWGFRGKRAGGVESGVVFFVGLWVSNPIQKKNQRTFFLLLTILPRPLVTPVSLICDYFGRD